MASGDQQDVSLIVKSSTGVPRDHANVDISFKGTDCSGDAGTVPVRFVETAECMGNGSTLRCTTNSSGRAEFLLERIAGRSGTMAICAEPIEGVTSTTALNVTVPPSLPEGTTVTVEPINTLVQEVSCEAECDGTRTVVLKLRQRSAGDAVPIKSGTIATVTLFSAVGGVTVSSGDSCAAGDIAEGGKVDIDHTNGQITLCLDGSVDAKEVEVSVQLNDDASTTAPPVAFTVYPSKAVVQFTRNSENDEVAAAYTNPCSENDNDNPLKAEVLESLDSRNYRIALDEETFVAFGTTELRLNENATPALVAPDGTREECAVTLTGNAAGGAGN